MGHLAGSQEAAALRGEPEDEVVMAQEGLEALLHQQSEILDSQVIATVPAQQREGRGDQRLAPSRLHPAPFQDPAPDAMLSPFLSLPLSLPTQARICLPTMDKICSPHVGIP